MDSSNKAESVFHEQISRSEEKEHMAGQGQLGTADAVRPDAARVYAVSLRTTGENLELLTAGEAEHLLWALFILYRERESLAIKPIMR